jgi:hypothetical protein
MRPLALAASALALLLLNTSAQQVNITATVDTSSAPSHSLSSTFLSVNIDTGSLFNLLDFTDPVLTQLLSQLSPVILRVGGGAADATLFTGDSGASGDGGSTPLNSHTVLVNSSYFDQLLAFAGKAGAKVMYDLNGLLRDKATGAWDPTINATALFTHIASNPSLAANVAGWQLGNEPTLWKKSGWNVDGKQLGEDYIALRKLLSGSFPSLPQTIYGPEGCCGDTSFLQDFLPVVHAAGALDGFSEHYYPITPNGPACTVADYLTKSKYDATTTLMGTYSRLRDQYAPGTPVILGETATTNMGGCPGLSDRFVAGFYFLYMLGELASHGVAQVNRQDLTGFSSQTEPSQYLLAGPPGWVRGPGLTPHPDYFLAVLFKQIVGSAALNVTVAGDAGGYAAANVGVHAWCAKEGTGGGGGGGAGGVPACGGSAFAVTYINTGGSTVQLALGQGVASTPRTEWVLSSAPAAAASGDSSSAPPSSLTGDQAFLNGQPLTVGPDGKLPQFPIPGRQVPAGGNAAMVLPPYSFGFFVVG